MSRDQYDDKQFWRCPQLGGGVPFSHCRKTNDTLPCPRIIECWGRKIDMPRFLVENYTEEELKKALKPSGGRLATIFDTAEKFSR